MRRVSLGGPAGGDGEAQISSGFEQPDGLAKTGGKNDPVDGAGIVFDADDHAVVFLVRGADLTERAHEGCIPDGHAAAGGEL